ncbi:hypothetical protein SLA2020_011770 [Shorea laevis]
MEGKKVLCFSLVAMVVVVLLLGTITPAIAIRYVIGNGIFPTANMRNCPLPYGNVVGNKTDYGCINSQWHFGPHIAVKSINVNAQESQ